MQFTSKFFNIHTQKEVDRTYILANDVEVQPLMKKCLEHFFAHLNPDIDPKDVRVVRQAPNRVGCRYHIVYSYINPATRKPKRTTHKYTVNPVTKELYFK